MSVITVRRRPTNQRALIWTGHNRGEAQEFLGTDYAGTHIDDARILLLWTMENRGVPFEARPGSVLMEGAIRGEHWAVDGGVFAETYRYRGLARVRAWLGRKARG